MGFISVLCIVLAWFVQPGTASAQLGRTVTNVATVSYDTDRGSLTHQTNPAEFVIEAFRTPSTIEFFRYAPNAPDSFQARINGSDYNPESGAAEPSGGDTFVPVGKPQTIGNMELDFSVPVSLVAATTYIPGELMIVRVIDVGQNGDPTAIECIEITIQTDLGDQIELRLYESGEDTGEFYAYVPSSREETPPNDVTLSTPNKTVLTARYVDAFDATEVSVDTALVDPFGRVFDSFTGELIDGTVVSIVDAATGELADVFGVDGVSPYPSTLVTGSVVTDAGGQVYELEPGEFLFPLMRPGLYRVIVSPPEGYLFASSFEESQFEDLNNAPFAIIPGSYGGVFEVEATGPLNFDIPIDPAAELVVLKNALSDSAAPGDTVAYSIRVMNRDIVPALIRVEDIMPRGMRYVDGSVSSDVGSVEVDSISDDGRTVTFQGGILFPGEQLTLTYAASVTAGAKVGTAVNSAVAVNTAGNPVSNKSEAAVEIVEDLLRSRLTLVGRVAEAACDPDQDWAKDLEHGLGVPGVRLYMETGEYVVTDQDGLYHFQGVRPGTHVLQIDEETLPPGYEPMICEENSRYAGSAISKFVDAKGGMIWRANFYLTKREGVEEEVVVEEFDDTVEYRQFDLEWLETADAAPRWAYPNVDRTPSSRSVNIGIVHPKRHTVELSLNGTPVSATNFSGRDSAQAGPAEISRWRGVDIRDGMNEFIARVLDPSGAEVTVLREEIWHVAKIEKATLVADQSVLVADGRSIPVIAVRLENHAGRPVHRGRIVRVDVSEPFMLKREVEFEGEAALVAASANAGISVDANGVAHVELEPTLQTGRVRLNVMLDSGRSEEIDVWLTPEKRDWIVVGLAEGSMELARDKGAFDDGTQTLNDGRIAFFAKGMIKGDWLMTLAVDTAKRRGDSDVAVFENHIDPNAYYTLYGDQTYQHADAESRYPLYVRLEKDAVQLIFGDYDTDMNDTVLGRYSRRMSGFKATGNFEKVSFTAFAAETNQSFVKDELAADGTSGPFRVTSTPMLRNSEVITVETRDRLRPDAVSNVRTLTRYFDYEIDFQSGEIIFRHPIAATDANFNPNVIVVDYEVAGVAERNVTLGGRVAVRTEDGRLEAGVTYVREEGGATVDDQSSSIVAVDATAKLDEVTELRAEVATSTREAGAGTERADAYLLEVERQSETLTVTGFYREEEAGFGLGQQASNTDSIRRIGAQVSALIDETATEQAKTRRRLVDANAYREENLSTDASRDVAEISARQEMSMAGGSVGLKAVREKYDASEDERTSLLLTGSVNKTFVEQGITLTASHEQPLGDAGDEATQFPMRTQLGVDKIVNEKVTLNLRHEMNNGANASGNNTVAGVTVKPWAGGEVRASADTITQDSARQVGATLGVDQTFIIDETWSASVGASRRARVDGGDEPRDLAADDVAGVLEDGVRSNLVQSENYSSAYAGVGYRTDSAAGSGRVEYRNGATSKRLSATVGAAREASEELSYGVAMRAQKETFAAAPTHELVEARIGSAWRPKGEGTIVFDRVDVKHERLDGVMDTQKIVNNLGANTMLSERTQAAVNWGVKYSKGSVAGTKVNGFTHLVGGEIRHDLTKRIDVGLSASVLMDDKTKTKDYAFGPSVGFKPAENVWVSVGYNFSGYTDDDFEGAEYSRKGAFVKLRVKFDQHTAKGLLEKISP